MGSNRNASAGRRLAALSAGATVLFFTLGRAAAAGPPSEPPPAFAAVSIKPYARGDRPLVPGKAFFADPAGLHIFNRTLGEMICYAYGIFDFQLIGGPAWVRSGSSATFDLDATSSAPASDAQLRSMLQTALAQRFGLVLAPGKKDFGVLALMVAPGGPKLRPLGDGEQPPPAIHFDPDSITYGYASISDFVTSANTRGFFGLSRIMGRPFVDETGLAGRYDIELTFKTTAMADGRNHVHAEALPAVLKSVGLELKPITGDMPVYTIQAAHKPAPN